jgi:hypothetical protein
MVCIFKQPNLKLILANCIAMRVEFGKSCGRLERWEEELRLVTEEIRRTPWSLESKASRWESIAGARDVQTDLSDAVKMGCRAYAAKQAYIWRKVYMKFISEWRPLLAQENISVLWPTPKITYDVFA